MKPPGTIVKYKKDGEGMSRQIKNYDEETD
jgi:hypothetical protein